VTGPRFNAVAPGSCRVRCAPALLRLALFRSSAPPQFALPRHFWCPRKGINSGAELMLLYVSEMM
jgi:hypothetical protein